MLGTLIVTKLGKYVYTYLIHQNNTHSKICTQNTHKETGLMDVRDESLLFTLATTTDTVWMFAFKMASEM